MTTPPAADPEAAAMTCGIKHGFGDQTCVRERGHEGLCRSRSFPGPTGTITYSEWWSKDGKFHRHHAYQTIYPANANKGGPQCFT